MLNVKINTKQMWYAIRNSLFREPLRRYHVDAFSNIIFCDIDCGVIWNPHGKEFSEPIEGEGWVWCSVDRRIIINYINQMWDRNYLPIFFTESKSNSKVKKLIEEIVLCLEYDPIFVIGSTPQRILKDLSIIRNSSKSNKIFPYTISDDVSTFSIPERNDVQYASSIKKIGLDPSIDFSDPLPNGIVILMGQPCCGKSKYASYLANKGYIHISEKKASAIRMGRDSEVKNFKELLSSILDKSVYGVVIDASNPTYKQRQHYINYVISLSLPYKILWISSPGYFYNNKRSIKIPRVILEAYSTKLELPKNDPNFTRIV